MTLHICRQYVRRASRRFILHVTVIFFTLLSAHRPAMPLRLYWVRRLRLGADIDEYVERDYGAILMMERAPPCRAPASTRSVYFRTPLLRKPLHVAHGL